MELPDVGEMCSHPSCRSLDYLPVRCTDCALFFCSHHALGRDHGCKAAVVVDRTIPQCPICEQFLQFVGVDIHVVVNRHIASGCTSDVFSTEKKKKKSKYNDDCHVHKCRNRGKWVSACPHCSLDFCLDHLRGAHACANSPTARRAAEAAARWNTPRVGSGPQFAAAAAAEARAAAAALDAARTAEATASQRTPPPPLLPTEAPSETTTSTVMTLAQIKREAQGNTSIPERERFYLYLTLPSSAEMPFGIPTFVSENACAKDVLETFGASLLGAVENLGLFRGAPGHEQIPDDLPFSFMSGFVESGALVCIEATA